MKLYNTFVAFFIAFILSSTCSLAQSTLGLSYSEVKVLYNSKANFTNWRDEKANDGSPYVSYEDRNLGISIASYFDKDGIVEQYRITGDAKEWANVWGEYADKNYAKQGNSVWIDYATGTKWHLKVKEGGIAYFACIKLDD